MRIAIRPFTKSTLVGLVVVPLAALALTACGGDDDSDDLAPQSQPTATSSGPGDPGDAGDPTSEPVADPSAAGADETAALLAAGTTGERSVADSTVVSIDRTTAGWHVGVVTPDGVEHEMDVALDGKSLVSDPVVEPADSDDAADRAEQQQVLQAAKLGHVAAVRAALDASPGSRVTEADLGSEDGGQPTWEIQVVDAQQLERTITVDAVTGDVVRDEVED